jgi:hypothetical protein
MIDQARIIISIAMVCVLPYGVSLEEDVGGTAGRMSVIRLVGLLLDVGPMLVKMR